MWHSLGRTWEHHQESWAVGCGASSSSSSRLTGQTDTLHATQTTQSVECSIKWSPSGGDLNIFYSALRCLLVADCVWHYDVILGPVSAHILRSSLALPCRKINLVLKLRPQSYFVTKQGTTRRDTYSRGDKGRRWRRTDGTSYRTGQNVCSLHYVTYVLACFNKVIVFIHTDLLTKSITR